MKTVGMIQMMMAHPIGAQLRPISLREQQPRCHQSTREMPAIMPAKLTMVRPVEIVGGGMLLRTPPLPVIILG